MVPSSVNRALIFIKPTPIVVSFSQISLNLVIFWQFCRCVLDMCALRNSMQNLCVIRGTTFTRKRFAEYKICINMLIKARMADVCAERRAHDLARTTRG